MAIATRARILSGWMVSRLSFLVLLVSLSGATIQAQVVRDGTIGPGASVQPTGPAFEVTEAMGEAAGGNLFHSFSQFTFGERESVSFLAGERITNIFARVTGGVPSIIGGRLTSPRNLFLINPFGFLFDASARLDVNGALHAATSDYIEFVTGERFTASRNSDTILSVADTFHFGFLDSNPRAPIVVKSDLGSSGTAVSLIGGLSQISGGRVMAVRDNGYSDVTIDRGSGNLRLDRVFIRGGKISLAGSEIDIRRSALLAVTRDIDGGGAEVSGGKEHRIAIDMKAVGRISIDGTVVASDTSGEGRGGDLRIRSGAGQDIVVGGASALVAQTNWRGTKNVVRRPFSVTTDPNDLRGDGGNLFLSSGRDLIVGSSDLITQNLGNGNGGGIVLDAARDVRIQGQSFVESHPRYSFTGPVVIDAGRDVRFVASTVKSDAGPDFDGTRSTPEAILVRAPNGQISAEASTISTKAEFFGDGFETTIPGPITLEGRTIDITAGSSVNASDVTVFETGGTVTLNATERIDIARSGIESSGRGKPGVIRIQAPRVTVADQSRVESINASGNDPGRILITAPDALAVSDSAIRADGGIFPGVVSLSGGDVSLTRSNVTSVVAQVTDEFAPQTLPFGVNIAASNLRIEGGAITARSDSAAPAGSITIDVENSLRMSGGAEITTTSGSGAGGDLTLNIGKLLEAIDSEVSTSVLGGAGGGGNILIEMGDDSGVAIMILERSQLTAQAVQGRGGNMTITTGLFVASGDPQTIVSASSELGISGEVQIDAPDASIVGTLAALPAVFLDAAELIREGCAARRPGNAASLFVRGRGGLPAQPGGLLPVQPANAAGRTMPEMVGAVIGTTRDGRPALLTVRCDQPSAQ
jgi:filamentous hemagglutinin family protein